jgi:hypothetical protein
LLLAHHVVVAEELPYGRVTGCEILPLLSGEIGSRSILPLTGLQLPESLIRSQLSEIYVLLITEQLRAG